MIVLGYVSCKEPYEPKVISGQNHFLVVEGFIVPDTGTTNIYLSRTIGLDQEIAIKEDNAIVTVETESGKTFKLTAQGDGRYAVKGINIGTEKARLKIVTKNETYSSSFEIPSYTPEIDSLSFKKMESNDVAIYVSTHSTNPNIQRYFYWNYKDTWSFTSLHKSYFYYDPVKEKVLPRVDDIYNCWKTKNSTDVLVGSSERYATNTIENFKLMSIPYGSEKLAIQYSIQVKQYSVNKSAWQYWENLKKSTENLGSIFDAQPSLLRGNITNHTNPDDIIVGYISVSTPVVKRIFIKNKQVSPWSSSSVKDLSCSIDTVKFGQEKAKFGAESSLIPIREAFDVAGFPFGYLRTSRKCVDCTLYGTNVKPPFWP